MTDVPSKLARPSAAVVPNETESPRFVGNNATALAARTPTLAPTVLLFAAILLVAANLRPAVTSLGAVLDEVRGTLHASSTWASLLTAVPGLCFGLAGFAAPFLARRLGLSRAIGVSMVLLTGGILVRVLDGPTTVLAGTLIACGGIAVCNVLIPVVVRESYPHRLALITGLYTAAVQAAAALGSLLTPPVDAAFGGWRPALGQWALIAAVATLGWFVAARPAPGASARAVAIGAAAGPRRSLLRSPLAWQVTGFFGFQAMGAYMVMGWAPQVLMSAGVSRGEAGAMMAVMGVLGMPGSLLVAPIALRRRSQSGWLVALTGMSIVGALGLLVAPGAAPWLWVVLIGIGMGAFALALGVISLRTRTTADTATLSTMSQSTGYLLAAVGPLVFGILHGATGSWSASLLVMLVGLGAQLVFGFLAGRPRFA